MGTRDAAGVASVHGEVLSRRRYNTYDATQTETTPHAFRAIVATRELFAQRCVNSCGGDPTCRRLACCHDCGLYVGDACTNDGTYAFVPRYFARLARA